MDDEPGSCVLVSRGCSSSSTVDLPHYPTSITRVSPCSTIPTPTTTTTTSTTRTRTRAVAIPQLSGSVSPHGSLVFSDQPFCSSSRPPLPCGGIGGGAGGVGGGGGGGVGLRRRPEVAGSPGNLTLGRHSLRGSASSLLSTSPGSDTSYIMGR